MAKLVANPGAVGVDAITDKIYPVGSIYMSVASTSPATLFGGTWERLKSRFLLGAEDAGDTTGDPYIGGATGGAASVSYTPAGTVGGHTLTTAEIPSHSHGLNSHTHTYYKAASSVDDCAATTGSHMLTVGEMPSHAHSIGYIATVSAGGSTNNNIWRQMTSGTRKDTGSSGSGSGHNHSMSHSHTLASNSTNTGGCTSNTAAAGSGGSHDHGFTGTQATINTMPPFLSVYMWKRTA